MKDSIYVLEYNSPEASIGAVRVETIECIEVVPTGYLDERGQPVPPGTKSSIITNGAMTYSTDEAAGLIATWKRKLERIMSRE